MNSVPHSAHRNSSKAPRGPAGRRLSTDRLDIDEWPRGRVCRTPRSALPSTVRCRTRCAASTSVTSRSRIRWCTPRWWRTWRASRSGPHGSSAHVRHRAVDAEGRAATRTRGVAASPGTRCATTSGPRCPRRDSTPWPAPSPRARIVKRHRLDAVHARNHVPLATALIVRRLTGCRLIFDVRGLMAEEYVDAGRWREAGSRTA